MHYVIPIRATGVLSVQSHLKASFLPPNLSLQELQQHDVQELNRILFAAIESSLVGTSGEHLIGQLYHGTAAQQVHDTITLSDDMQLHCFASDKL